MPLSPNTDLVLVWLRLSLSQSQGVRAAPKASKY